MVDRRKLVDDPNTSYDDTKLLGQQPSTAYQVGRTAAAPLRAVVDSAKYNLGHAAEGNRIIGGAIERFGRGVLGLDDAPPPGAAPAAPQPTRPQGPDTTAPGYQQGRAAGLRARDFLAERDALAPGVRRWGSETADPAEVYMTVDRNGNRVYTDSARFAASQSRGRLTRRDLAPGMTASDADRTLNDPEGGFTYGPASQRAVQQLARDSLTTGGKSAQVERALQEAMRAQAIAETRAGTRDLDKRREEQGRMVRRNITGDDGQSLDPRVLIALQRLGLDERKFAAEREDKAAERTASQGRDALASTKGVADLLKGVQDGSIDPQDARDLLGGLPGEAGARGARGLRRALLQRVLTQRSPFFLGSDEIQYADPASIRRNPDGSGTFTEADDGLFDIQRNIDLSPEELSQILGSPDDQDATREEDLRTRLRRGY